MDDMSRYLCPKGHVVGFIRADGHSVNRLLYLRDSIDDSAASPAEPSVTAIIDSGDVTCTICGASIVWIPSAPALERLIERNAALRRRFRRVETVMNNVSFLERG
jgi:hypothetical protein